MSNIQNHSFATLKVQTILILPQMLGKHVVKPPLHTRFVLLIIHKIAVLPIPSLQMPAQPSPLPSQGKGPHSATANNCCFLMANTIPLNQKPEEKQF